MSSLQPCTLITGANGGLGQFFVQEAAQTPGQTIVLIGRDREKLQSIIEKNNIQDRSIMILTDLAQTDKALSVITNELEKRHLWIETLINNAGFGLFGSFAETDGKIEQEMISVNISTLTALTKFVLPQMKRNNQGNILNVASVAAFFPGPYMSVYYATKAYVLSFSLALREELKSTNIHVTALCPGSTSTGFAKKAQAQKVSIFQGKLATPEDVAAFGWDALQRNAPLAIHGSKNRVMIALTRLIPLSLLSRMVGRVQKNS